MIHGHRWVATGIQVFQLEDGKAHSRHFVGQACQASEGWNWYVTSQYGSHQGNEPTKRRAQDRVEFWVRVGLGLQCEHGIRTGDYCEPCNIEYKAAAEAAEKANRS